MKTAHVCFLWHMHQPYYTDPASGTASMPWVRLHASKAYFDMAWILERHPAMHATVNFTPSLLRQIEELSSGTVHDLFLDHARRPASDLTPVERAFIVRYFFSANWATMVRPHARYHELLAKRGTDVHGEHAGRIAEIAQRFSVQEMRDLQVWHNLAWFGFGAVSQFPRLAALRLKGRNFTEQDKADVLAIQHELLALIVPRYRALSERGQIEITTTPYFHPILPLVMDTDCARRARPDLPLPPRFRAPEDAAAQLRLAVTAHAERFGRPPLGLWPSEGSVCPELLPLVHEAGLRWFATDEGVLARSLPDWDRNRSLYRPYTLGEPGQELRAVFRDRELSDLVGFTYSKSVPESAVDDLCRRLAEVIDRVPHDEMLIPIILDGENAWEHYHDGGEAFLGGLYARLSKTGWPGGHRVMPQTVQAAVQHFPPVRLGHLHSGSWINADFKIWIGHDEDNRGWTLLREARERLVELTAGWPPERAAPAWDALYAAEGSDWFWWYGDDFETDYKQEFDRLFRTHLRNVYLRAGALPPAVLDDAIVQAAGSVVERVRHPVSLLSPVIDGRVSSFFEWRGAGEIDPSPPLGAMWKSSGLLRYIGFGCSTDALFVRLDPLPDALAGGVQAELHVTSAAARHRAVFTLASASVGYTLWRSSGGEPGAEVGRCGTIARQAIVEIAVAFKDLGLHAGDEFKLTLLLFQDGIEAERYPKHRPVTLTVPDENYEATMWRV